MHASNMFELSFVPNYFRTVMPLQPFDVTSTLFCRENWEPGKSSPHLGAFFAANVFFQACTPRLGVPAQMAVVIVSSFRCL